MIKASFVCMLTLVIGTAAAMAVQADMLVLTDGRVVEGRFVAGSETFIQFRTDSGIESFPLNQVSSIHLKSDADSTLLLGADSGSTQVPAPETAALPAGAVMVPAGTKLWIRFDTKLSTSSEETGDPFNAVLDSDLVVEGKVAVARGSTVQGQVAEVRGGKKLGSQYLKLKLTSLTVGDQRIPLLTGPFGVEGGVGDVPKLIGAEPVATGGDHGLKAFAEDRDHVNIPKGAVLAVPLREPVALYP